MGQLGCPGGPGMVKWARGAGSALMIMVVVGLMLATTTAAQGNTLVTGDTALSSDPSNTSSTEIVSMLMLDSGQYYMFGTTEAVQLEFNGVTGTHHADGGATKGHYNPFIALMNKDHTNEWVYYLENDAHTYTYYLNSGLGVDSYESVYASYNYWDGATATTYLKNLYWDSGTLTMASVAISDMWTTDMKTHVGGAADGMTVLAGSLIQPAAGAETTCYVQTVDINLTEMDYYTINSCMVLGGVALDTTNNVAFVVGITAVTGYVGENPKVQMTDGSGSEIFTCAACDVSLQNEQTFVLRLSYDPTSGVLTKLASQLLVTTDASANPVFSSYNIAYNAHSVYVAARGSLYVAFTLGSGAVFQEKSIENSRNNVGLAQLDPVTLDVYGGQVFGTLYDDVSTGVVYFNDSIVLTTKVINVVNYVTGPLINPPATEVGWGDANVIQCGPELNSTTLESVGIMFGNDTDEETSDGVIAGTSGLYIFGYFLSSFGSPYYISAHESAASAYKGYVLDIYCPSSSQQLNYLSNTCEDCATGRYGPFSGGNVGCPMCAAGSITNVTGQVSCTLCELGTAAATSGLDTCTNCTAGTYADVLGLATCKNCAEGTYSNSSAAVVCTPCDGGFFAAAAGSRGCSECPAGTYSNSGAESCAECNRGSYSSSSGSSACSECGVGSYADSRGLTSCTECTLESTTIDEGSVTSRQCICDAAFYGDWTSGRSCKACPQNAVCAIKNNAYPQALPGYFVSVSSPGDVYYCLPRSACPGGLDTCASGYVERACAVCDTGYYRTSKGCQKCPATVSLPDAAVWPLVVASVLIVTGFLWGLICLIACAKATLSRGGSGMKAGKFKLVAFCSRTLGNIAKRLRNITTVSKVIKFGQFMSITFSLSTKWPASIETTAHLMQVMVLDTSHLLQTECRVSSTYTSIEFKYISVISGFLHCFACIVALMMVAGCCRRHAFCLIRTYSVVFKTPVTTIHPEPPCEKPKIKVAQEPMPVFHLPSIPRVERDSGSSEEVTRVVPFDDDGGADAALGIELAGIEAGDEDLSKKLGKSRRPHKERAPSEVSLVGSYDASESTMSMVGLDKRDLHAAGRTSTMVPGKGQKGFRSVRPLKQPQPETRGPLEKEGRRRTRCFRCSNAMGFTMYSMVRSLSVTTDNIGVAFLTLGYLAVHMIIMQPFTCFLGSPATDTYYMVSDPSQICFDVTDDSWRNLATIGIVLFCMFSLGVPLVIACIIFRYVRPQARREIAAATLSPEAGLVGDLADNARYTGLRQPFKPKYYYWELVLMLQKLIFGCGMTLRAAGEEDVLGFMGFMSLAMFTNQVYFQPYRRQRDNLMEFMIGLTLTLTVFAGLLYKAGSITRFTHKFLEVIVVGMVLATLISVVWFAVIYPLCGCCNDVLCLGRCCKKKARSANAVPGRSQIVPASPRSSLESLGRDRHFQTAQ